MRSERQPASIPFTGDAEPVSDLRQWEAPLATERVILPQTVIEELRRAAIQAFLAIPKRGLEVGGLLLGEVRNRNHQIAVFHVTEAEEVSCEHSFGPSYILSETDKGLLAERMERHRLEGARPVIGFYRSYTGRDAEPDEADQDLLRTFFPQGDFVCLLLQPLSVEKCLACFRFRGHGKMLTAPLCEPFPFDSSQMEPFVPEPFVPEPFVAEPPAIEPVGKPTGTAEPRHPAFAPAAEAVPSTAAPEIPWHHRYREEEGSKPQNASLLGVLPTVLICVLFVIAFAAVYQLWTLRGEPRWEPLRFDARMSDGKMILGWDAAAPAVTQAERGVLLVNDGRDPRTIQLSPEQLRSGNLSYSPASADLRFRLRLYGGGTSVVTDTLRVITMPSPPPVLTERPATAPPTATAPPPAPEPAAVKPPVVRHEVQPEIPAGIRRRIASPRTVRVVVEIDESGRVRQASVPAVGSGLDRYLADEALSAARRWIFTPARAPDGTPVAVRKTLTFDFTPGH